MSCLLLICIIVPCGGVGFILPFKKGESNTDPQDQDYDDQGMDGLKADLFQGMVQQHFQSDEDQQEGKAMFQIAEAGHEVHQKKEE